MFGKKSAPKPAEPKPAASPPPKPAETTAKPAKKGLFGLGKQKSAAAPPPQFTGKGFRGGSGGGEPTRGGKPGRRAAEKGKRRQSSGTGDTDCACPRTGGSGLFCLHAFF